jgi:serine O-acetyltransferase
MSAAGRSVPEGHPRLGEAIRGDLTEMAKAKGTPYPSLGGLLDVLSLPGTLAAILWRLGNAAHFAGLKPLSRLCYVANIVLFGAELHPGAVVAPGVVIPHPVGIGVAKGCRIGARCRLMRSIAMGGSGDPDKPGHPMIGDDVWVMDGAKLFGPVHVGDRSILGTSAVVASDVPADMFVYGARRSDRMRPLHELGLGDHGGSLAGVEEATAAAARAASIAEQRLHSVPLAAAAGAEG